MSTTTAKKTMLSVRGIHTCIRLDKGVVVHCVDNVDLEIFEHEVFGLVGESGSGKTILALSIMGLLGKYPGVVHGTVDYTDHHGRTTRLISEDGRSGEVNALRPTLKNFKAKLKRHNHSYDGFRGSHFSLVFQDPQTSLNPYLSVGQQLFEAVRKGAPRLSHARAGEEALEWLKKVRIRDPQEIIGSYPHMLSGGMGQRVMIAIALASRPEFIVADEPTTGLDVTTQSRIVELFQDLKAETGVTIVMISHDLGMVAQLADRMGVMYCGKMLEVGPVDEIVGPGRRHPYTVGLLNSLPKLGQRYREVQLIAIPEDVPSNTDPPSGCRFHPRCQVCLDGLKSGDGNFFARCKIEEPSLFEVSEGHSVRCWLYHDCPCKNESLATVSS